MFSRVFIAVWLLAGSLLGCASAKINSETDLDRKVREEPHANSPEDIANRAAKVFSEAPGLSEDQKRKLSAVYLAVYAEAMAIRTEIGQSKSLLFKLIATTAYKSKEVDQLKQKIVALDQRRLKIMFEALADVQKIVGHGPGKENIYRHFRQHENPFEGLTIGRHNASN